MDTRQKILDKAREMFNKQGVEAVSLREISKALSISHGNLRYHFPGKGVLVGTLLDDCLNQNTVFIEELMESNFSMEKLIEINWKASRKAWEFRFLTRDMSHKADTFPEVRERLLQNYAERKLEFLALFQFMESQGLIDPEKFDGQYTLLIDELMVHIEFGFANIELYYPGREEDKIRRYHKRLFLILMPYLSPLYQDELIRSLKL